MSRTDSRCCNCDAPAAGCSLPVGESGPDACEFVPVSYTGAWGGMPACRICFELHAAAGDNARAVLNAYEKHAREEREALQAARTAIVALDKMVSKLRDDFGEP